MADNRMFLIHKPSKLGIMLGRRFGVAWSSSIEAGRMDAFYNLVGDLPNEPDNFILAMEDGRESGVFDEFEYDGIDDSGFHRFKL